MHHCLQVQEILAVVAKHLQSLYTKLDQWQPAQLQAYSKDLDSSEVFESSWPSLEDLRRQRATLVPFSLTCKYFHEVAAEIMWQTLYLEHLCLTVPRELTAEPTQAEQHRVLSLARHVQELDTDCKVQHFSNLVESASVKPEGPIFPKLKHLYIRGTTDEVKYLPTLLGSTNLQKVEIDASLYTIQASFTGVTPHPELNSIVQTIAEYHPSLRQLLIQNYFWLLPPSFFGPVLPLDCKLISLFTNLGTFSTNLGLTRDMLVQLGSLPSLSKLQCQLVETNKEGARPYTALPDNLFPCLEMWRVVGDGLSPLLFEFLRTCKMTNLLGVELVLKAELVACLDSSSLHTLFTVLGMHISLQVVNLVTSQTKSEAFCGFAYLGTPDKDQLVTDEVIAPLYKCRNLRTLSLPPCPAALNSTSLDEMSNAWPYLEMLIIGTYWSGAINNMTWDSLSTSASRFSRLRVIGLNVIIPSQNLRALTSPDFATTTARCSSVKLVCLNCLSQSKLPLPLSEMVGVISATFPGATVTPLYPGCSIWYEDQPFWDKFRYCLDILRLTKEQRRRFVYSVGQRRPSQVQELTSCLRESTV
ncbi:hypothetical protein EIP86_006352 [Pleurotus ostreatoroseus]|nr:hypothetical protein EIP86_006352 [Pleurotus ostreatoroseus]